MLSVGQAGGICLGTAGVIARLALTAHRRKVVSGREELIGSRGTILDWEDGRGHVFVHSERWRATGGASLRAGESITVTSLEGLTLQVEPVGLHSAQTKEG